jgi:nicotinamidase-related amidase
MIKGNVAVIAVDLQCGVLDENSRFYDPGYVQMVERSRELLDLCRELEVPIVYLQEIHRSNNLDFGRELDGDEGRHCLEDSPYTAVAEKQLGRIPEKEPLVQKRRYSGFLYTELEVVLSGLGIHPNDTLILFGGFTDVCVHYTFVDAHQRDYRLRVVKDLCQPSSPTAHVSALEAMRYLQHEAPCTRDEVMAELREHALTHN